MSAIDQIREAKTSTEIHTILNTIKQWKYISNKTLNKAHKIAEARLAELA